MKLYHTWHEMLHDDNSSKEHSVHSTVIYWKYTIFVHMIHLQVMEQTILTISHNNSQPKFPLIYQLMKSDSIVKTTVDSISYLDICTSNLVTFAVCILQMWFEHKEDVNNMLWKVTNTAERKNCTIAPN